MAAPPSETHGPPLRGGPVRVLSGSSLALTATEHRPFRILVHQERSSQ